MVGAKPGRSFTTQGNRDQVTVVEIVHHAPEEGDQTAAAPVRSHLRCSVGQGSAGTDVIYRVIIGIKS